MSKLVENHCAVEMQKINKSFDGVKVLSDVDFELVKGEIHGIVGQNGAGKSTLIKILNGVHTRDSGKISINGISIKENENPINPEKYGISTVFQEFSLIPYLSVAENIFLNNEPRRVFLTDDRTIEERVKEILRELKIDKYINPREKVADLSVSFRQLVEISKAISRKSNILVLDEPTSALSYTEKNLLFQVMRELKSKGVSIIFISHYLDEILRLCDRVTVLRDGKKILTDETKNIDIDQIVKAMIGDKKRTNYFNKRRREVDYGRVPSFEVSIRTDSSRKLRDVKFSVYRGEVLGIAGLLGSGRSEILNSICGLDKRATKIVKIEGEEINIRDVNDAKKYGIILIPEDRKVQGLVLSFSVKDNILLPILNRLAGFLFLLKDRKGDGIVKTITKKLEIVAENIYQKVKSLSGGNQQKVVIAKALVQDPKILLLDDPTVGVDIGAKEDIFEIIHQLAKEGKCVVLVSSEFSELLDHCDRILVLKQGMIIKEIKCSMTTSFDEKDLLKLV